MLHRACFSLSLAAALALSAVAPRVALADKPSASAVARAVELKKQAGMLMDDFKYAEAYALYVEAYSITADPALLYNQGRALEAMGEYPRALTQLELFDRTAPPDVKALVPALDELLANIRARVSKLTVRSDVPHTKLLVRDQLMGDFEGKIEVPVRAGQATITVLADGYEAFKQDVTLPGNGALNVVAKLVPNKEFATIGIKAKPEGTLVTIDGKSYGPVPIDARVGAGQHTIVLHHADYEDASFPLLVTAGETRRIDTTLKLPPSVLSKWWFWTGIGAVAVTGVVVGVALVSEKPADSGTFSPGQVRGVRVAF